MKIISTTVHALKKRKKKVARLWKVTKHRSNFLERWDGPKKQIYVPLHFSGNRRPYHVCMEVAWPMTSGIAECLWGPNVCQPLYSHKVMFLYIFFLFWHKTNKWWKSLHAWSTFCCRLIEVTMSIRCGLEFLCRSGREVVMTCAAVHDNVDQL